MDFELTEEQKLLGQTVKEFTKREIEPMCAQIEDAGKLPDTLIKKMSAMGLMGMVVPRQYGGAGANVLDCILSIEQLAYSGNAAWWLVSFGNSIPDCLSQFGSEELKRKYLPPVCDGSSYPSIQFTEEETGSDSEAITTTAVLKGQEYLINGRKRFSTFGARDGFAITYARDETGKISAFVLDKNTAGYSAEKVWELMGQGGVEAVDVRLENVRVPQENMLGNRGEGINYLLNWIALEKVTQCAACVGMAQAALDEAIKYAGARVIRKKPLSAMQGIRWSLADMHSNIQAARWLTYRTAFLYDHKSPDFMNEAASTKLFVAPAAIEVVEESRRIHGAYGYTREMKIEGLCRAVSGATAIAVSLEINRSIVGASLLK
ncbi:acyl-CoA dehydrogenase family protein [Chloroflexota bacterium]